MLAKVKSAEARMKIQESLDGLSLDADSQALDNVRESIEKESGPSGYWLRAS